MKKLLTVFIIVCLVLLCAVSFSGCSVDDFGSTVGGWFDSVKNAVSDWVNGWFDTVDVDNIDLDKDSIIFP